MKIKVKLNGGPKDGQWVDYTTPLPKIIVIAEVTKERTFHYDDYLRRGNTEQYDFVKRSKESPE